jgi:hypothetical protein
MAERYQVYFNTCTINGVRPISFTAWEHLQPLSSK